MLSLYDHITAYMNCLSAVSSAEVNAISIYKKLRKINPNKRDIRNAFKEYKNDHIDAYKNAIGDYGKIYKSVIDWFVD